MANVGSLSAVVMPHAGICCDTYAITWPEGFWAICKFDGMMTGAAKHDADRKLAKTSDDDTYFHKLIAEPLF